jgi:hypothetical protein
MGVFDKLKTDLRDAYLRRGVKRVVYFHCDHWEPWRAMPRSDAICAENAAEVVRFTDVANSIDFARKLTLFYKCTVNYVFDHDSSTSEGQKVHPDDGIRFTHRPERWMSVATGALGYVARSSAMDTQVHIHHENVTYNTDHKKPEVVAYFDTARARHFEEERFDLLLKLALRSIEEETGRKLPRWFFVHGHWGLNASDPAVCHLTREIAILRANGCLGDFTVPSGRPVVNPRLEVPYFVTPTDAPKGYDLQEAGPELAYGNKTARERGKFLIWSSVIKHRGASLDYYAPWLRKRLDDIDALAHEYIAQSYLIDGTLFIKTHAHSMHPNYYEDTRLAIFPHAYPPIQNLLSVLFEAAANAGAEVSFLTASDVYDLMVTANYAPPEGFALTIPGVPPVVEGCIPADRRLPLEGSIITLTAPPSAGPAAPPVTKLSTAASRPATPEHAAAPLPGATAAVMLAERPLRDIAIIDSVARTVVRERLANLGEAASGAGGYYAQRAESDAFLTEYERALAKYFVSEPAFESYHEIGCGFGALPILLAANGMPTVGFEIDRKRADGSQTLLLEVMRKLAGEKRRLPATCEFICGRFPDAVAPRTTAKCVAFFTNVTATITPDQRRDIVTALEGYKAVVLDVQRFLDRRTTLADEDGLIAELTAAGLGRATELFQLRSAGRYVRFDPARP